MQWKYLYDVAKQRSFLMLCFWYRFPPSHLCSFILLFSCVSTIYDPGEIFWYQYIFRNGKMLCSSVSNMLALLAVYIVSCTPFMEVKMYCF